MGVSFETYLQRHRNLQRGVVTTSPRRLVAGWAVISSVVKGISGRGVRRAGRGYMNENF